MTFLDGGLSLCHHSAVVFGVEVFVPQTVIFPIGVNRHNPKRGASNDGVFQSPCFLVDVEWWIYIYIYMFIKKNLQICLSCIPPTRIQDRWSLFDCYLGGHDSWHLG